MSVFTTFYGELQELLIEHSQSIKRQTDSSTILGEDREFFIRTVLDRSLPSNIKAERGVIVDRKGKESNPQDLILYRTDFPIMATFVGSSRFLAEGVVASIEVKSNLDKKKFDEALSTLKTSHGLKGFGIEMPRGLPALDRGKYRRIVKESSYAKNQMSTRSYVFAYRGVLLNTLRKYILGALESGISFWGLPSAICILNRGICLIRDDGQVMSSQPDEGSCQCIYQLMKEKSRALEFFMLHVLSSCILSGPGLQIRGTPLRFYIFDYMDQPVETAPLFVDVQQDLSSLKIPWEGRRHITTNDLLREQGFGLNEP